MNNKKKKITVTARDLTLIRWVGVFAVLLVAVYFFIYPAISQHQGLVEKNEQLQAEVEKCSDSSIEALQSQAKVNYGTVNQLLSGYPTKMNSSQVDKLVTQIAEKNGVAVYSLTLGDKKTGTGYADSQQYATVPVYDTSNDSSKNNQKNNNQLTGIYVYTATAIFCGNENELQSVVDTLGNKEDYPYINLVSFSWEKDSMHTSASNSTNFLTVVMNIYAYETLDD